MDIIALIISGISLLIAIVSFFYSLPAQKLQNKLNQMELKLKEYELAKKEKENLKKACVEARVIKIAKGKYRLKVWNSGNETANNVIAEFNEESKIIIGDKEKMPFEILEPQKSFELWIIYHMGCANKFTITTSWEDLNGNKFSKSQMGDI